MTKHINYKNTEFTQLIECVRPGSCRVIEQFSVIPLTGRWMEFREDFIAICGDIIEGQILVLLEKWTKENGDWVCKSSEDIAQLLFLPKNKQRTIQRKLICLADKGFIESRTQKNSLDNTKEHRLLVDNIINAIADLANK